MSDYPDPTPEMLDGDPTMAMAAQNSQMMMAIMGGIGGDRPPGHA